MVDNKLLTKLSQNLLEILNDEEYYDITIEVGNDPYVKIFRAHMVILNYRSPYLRRILSTNKKNNDGTLTNIKLPNILPEIFQIILMYIYGGKLSLEEYDISDIIKILVAANELSLQELIPYLESFLIENKKNWIEQNIDLIYQTSFGNDSFLELQKYCTNLIIKESNKIFNSPNFSSIPEKLLITLIQNHQISEIQVWEHVIKWGLAQNPELSSDLTSFSKDDFNTLKKTLQKCIPLIKFRNLTSKEFLKKVKPYKKILPKELYDDLLEYFLDNDYDPNKKSESRTIEEIKSKNIDSNIITNKHVEIISKWINRLEITDKLASSYEFKLLYRDSEDSGELSERINKFHEVCDNHSQTVTIFKVKDRNEILGGYNPIEWKSDYSCGITKDSFIFSFNNENYILSRVKNEMRAITNYSNYGPSFGHDLCLFWFFNNDRKIHCGQKYYEKLNNDDSFNLDFFEVFQLCKTDD
ncbi:carbohydrate-binding module family 13 protein [Rhizophagus irregularis DAOM 181602=DAOM 197198]|nr:carbohydrate-binding module family 13 protein [Rhizophagus irregularis DAOM 181602=DAOM 197198]